MTKLSLFPLMLACCGSAGIGVQSASHSFQANSEQAEYEPKGVALDQRPPHTLDRISYQIEMLIREARRVGDTREMELCMERLVEARAWVEMAIAEESGR